MEGVDISGPPDRHSNSRISGVPAASGNGGTRLSILKQVDAIAHKALKRRCFLWFHNWEKWSAPESRRETWRRVDRYTREEVPNSHFDITWTEQSRTCLGCGLFVTRQTNRTSGDRP